MQDFVKSQLCCRCSTASATAQNSKHVHAQMLNGLLGFIYYGFSQNLNNQPFQPPTVQGKFFDMLFLMFHGEYSKWGVNLPSPKNLYQTICVL